MTNDKEQTKNLVHLLIVPAYGDRLLSQSDKVSNN